MTRFTSRRQFLGGLGAASALSPFIPLLNASGQEQAVAPKRLLLLFTPDGTAPSTDWMPQGSETDFAFHFIHQPLERYRSQVVIPWGMRLSANGAGEQHAYGMAGMFTGSTLHEASPGVNFDGGNGNRTGWGSGPSIDQVVARNFGPNMPYLRAADDAVPEVAYRTLELGVQCTQPHSVHRMIYRADSEPLHPEMNPQAAFDRLFGAALSTQAPEAAARARAEKRAIVDLVYRDLDKLRARVGREEFVKVENHVEGLRAIERRLDTAPLAAGCNPPDQPGASIRPGRENNATFPGEVEAMMDIVTSAFSCDLTRVASLQLSRGFSNITHNWLEHTNAHHQMSHDNSQNWDLEHDQIDNWYAQRVVGLLDRMSQIVEPGGTMLSNTLIVWGRELGNTNHRMDPVPMMLLGGARGQLQGGRFLQVGDAGLGGRRARTPHSALLTSVGRLMGLDINGFGNIDPDQGPLPGIG